MSAFAVRIQETCDAYIGAYYRSTVDVLILAAAAFTAVHGYALTHDWEQWTVGEWLINYSGGFVRRGLTGEVLLAISGRTGAPANVLVFATFVTLIGVFSVRFASLLRHKRITFWYLFLCLSPACLLFTLYNPEAIGRQELVVYVAFIAWADAYRRGSLTPAMLSLFAAVAFVATLVHELFVLFTPYFVLLSFVLSNSGHVEGDWRRALVVPAGACAGLAALLLFGHALNGEVLCGSIVRTGAPAKVCEGILAYGDPDPVRAVRDFIGHLTEHSALSLVLVFPLILLPVYLFLTANADGLSAPLLIAFFALFITISAPLFVLAVDWGRWISIHVILQTVTCAFFLHDVELVREPKRAGGWRNTGPLLVTGLVILSTTLLWGVNYCCSDEFFHPLGPLRAIGSVLRSLA